MVTAQERYTQGTAASRYSRTISQQREIKRQFEQLPEQVEKRLKEEQAKALKRRIAQYTLRRNDKDHYFVLDEKLSKKEYVLKETASGYILISKPKKVKKLEKGEVVSQITYNPRVITFDKAGRIKEDTYYTGKTYKGTAFAEVTRTVKYDVEKGTRKEKQYDIVGYSTKLRSDKTFKDNQLVGMETFDNTRFGKKGIVDPKSKRWVAEGSDRFKQIKEAEKLTKEASKFSNQEQLRRYGKVVVETKDEPVKVLNERVSGFIDKQKRQLVIRNRNKLFAGTTAINVFETGLAESKVEPIKDIVPVGYNLKGNYTVLPEGVLSNEQSKERFYQYGGVLEEAPKPEGVVEKLRDKSDRARSELIRSDRYKESGAGFSPTALGLSTVAGFVNPIINPIEYTKSVGTTIKSFATDPFGTGAAIKEQAQVNPEGFAGEMLGQYILFKTIKTAATKSPIKVERVNYNFKTTGDGNVQVKGFGVKVGSRSPIAIAKVEVKPGVTDISTGNIVSVNQLQNLPFSSSPYTSYGIFNKGYSATVSSRVGALEQPIPFTELSGSTAQPITSSGGTVIRGILDYTPEEVTRVQSNVDVSYLLGSEKGLPVKDFIVNIEGVKNAPVVSRAVGTFVGKEGIIYGSLVTKQLEGATGEPFKINYLTDPTTNKPLVLSQFQNVKQGDIDVIFPDKTVAEIKPELEIFAKKLQTLGEDIEVSPRNDNVLQFKSTGEKFLEAKSGIDQDTLGLDDEAPAGYLGIKFPDFKKGQSPSIVPFGETRAIKIGEQLQRKGAGSTIMSPGEGGETQSFSQPGILGKQGNPRGLKDTAGFVQTATGIISIKSGKGVISKIKAKIAEKQLGKFFESYTPEQKKDIILKVKETTGTEDIKVKLQTKINQEAESSSPSIGSFVSSNVYSPSFVTASGSVSSLNIPSTSGFSTSSSKSLSISKSPSKLSSTSKSPSPSTSGRSSYTSPSPSDSPSVSYDFKPSNYTSSYTSPSPSSSYTSPSPSRSPIPKIPPSSFITVPKRKGGSGSNEEKAKTLIKQYYDVLVKRKQLKKGKGNYESRGYKKANQKPLSKTAALGLGAEITDTFTNRSFRIKKTNQKGGEPRQDLEAKWERLQSRFRIAKNKKDLVEKSKFSISSYQEKQGIPYESIRQRKQQALLGAIKRRKASNTFLAKKSLRSKKNKKKAIRFL